MGDLFQAVADRNYRQVKYLLSPEGGQADPNIPLRDWGDVIYPLHVAVETDMPNIIKLLLDAGADRNVIYVERVYGGNDGATPLDLAERLGYYHLIPLLDPNYIISSDTDVDDVDTDGADDEYYIIETDYTKVLMEGIKGNDLELVTMTLNLMEKRNEVIAKNVHWELLSAAIDRDNLDILDILIYHGLDINSTNYDGESQLGIAASKGNVDVINSLIFNGADINHRNKEGRTPLLEVYYTGYNNIFNLFLLQGADPFNDFDTVKDPEIRNLLDSVSLATFALRSIRREGVDISVLPVTLVSTEV